MYHNPYGPFYPPPVGGMDQKYIEFGMRQAEKLMTREAREKERADKIKRRKQEEDRKQQEARHSRTLLFIEWYILGILSYPFWAPFYNYMVAYAQHIR